VIFFQLVNHQNLVHHQNPGKIPILPQEDFVSFATPSTSLEPALTANLKQAAYIMGGGNVGLMPSAPLHNPTSASRSLKMYFANQNIRPGSQGRLEARSRTKGFQGRGKVTAQGQREGYGHSMPDLQVHLPEDDSCARVCYPFSPTSGLHE
jgi:hypothetical protein